MTFFKKTFLALAIIVLLTSVLVACGGNSDTTALGTTAPSLRTTPHTTETSSPDTKPITPKKLSA